MTDAKPAGRFGLLLLVAAALAFLILAKGAWSSENTLPLPVDSSQLSGYYSGNDHYAFSLRPEYAEQSLSFNDQEAKVEVKCPHSYCIVKYAKPSSYYEIGRFYLDGYFYKLIIYNSEFEFSSALFFQLNSYDPGGRLLDALLLESRFAFEDIQQFAEFRIDPERIFIDRYLTQVIEIINGGDLGQAIENPIPKVYCREQYKIDHGFFKLISKTDLADEL